MADKGGGLQKGSEGVTRGLGDKERKKPKRGSTWRKGRAGSDTRTSDAELQKNWARDKKSDEGKRGDTRVLFNGNKALCAMTTYKRRRTWETRTELKQTWGSGKEKNKRERG